MNATEPPLDGVLPLDKPAGPSSHDMVGTVRRALHMRRVGHTGTLDPFASGLLLLCIGMATRVAEYLSGLDKSYTARVRLGIATDTDDSTGTVTAERDPSQVGLADVEAALAPLRGDVLQRPPTYSAKKREGERAYAAARAGRALQLDPVRVRIHRLDITGWEPPHVDLEVVCGSGTYIRAIARDLGDALGVGGHLTALRRTAVGSHGVAGAVQPDELHDSARVAAALLPTLEAIRHLPRVDLDAAQQHDIRHGRAVRDDAADDEPVIVLAADDRIAGIAERRGGLLRPRKVFL